MEIKKDNINNNRRDLTSNVRGLSNYQLTVLKPYLHTPAKIPGTGARASIIKHVFNSATYTTNAGGNLCIVSCPNHVVDSAATETTFAVITDSTYNGTFGGTLTATNINTKSLFGINSGTAKAVRLVSQSIKIYSLSTALNRKGVIYGALVNNNPPTAQLYTDITAEAYAISDVQNSNTLKRANVSNGEGVLLCYLPTDEDDFQFNAPNTTPAQRHTNGDDVFVAVMICQGLEASSQVRVEIDSNFEIIPVVSSTLAGLETPGDSRECVPILDIQHIKVYHRTDLVRIIGAFDGGESFNPEIKRPIRQPLRVPFNMNIEEKIQQPIAKNLFHQVADAVKNGFLNSFTGGQLGNIVGGKRNLKARKPRKPKNTRPKKK
jgi:hypothetical protein